MDYISHEDYKDLMGKFQKKTPKGLLKEEMEEGNAFTAALAKAKKGEKVHVDGGEVTDTSDYDDPSVKEYGYADNYPGSFGYREGMHTPPLQATGQTIDTVENTVTNPPYGFEVLSPDEKKQLKEYLESMKTIKQEVAKLLGKAGKKLKEDGDTTGLVMHTEAEKEQKPSSKSAQDLKPGDIITSGEEVIGLQHGAKGPGDRVRDMSKVTIKLKKGGKERVAVWGKHTKIGIKS